MLKRLMIIRPHIRSSPLSEEKNIEFIGPEFSWYPIILGLFIVTNEEIGIN